MCGGPSYIVISHQFEEVSMLCQVCEHTWPTDLIAHPFLKELPPFKPVLR
jgi:hypothetical protein